MNFVKITSLSILIAFSFAACDAIQLRNRKQNRIHFKDAKLMISENVNEPSSLEVNIQGAMLATRLVEVASPMAEQIELHESYMTGGKMATRKVKDVYIGVPDVVRFRPNANRILVWGLNPSVVTSKTFSVTLTLDNGRLRTKDKYDVPIEMMKPVVGVPGGAANAATAAAQAAAKTQAIESGKSETMDATKALSAKMEAQAAEVRAKSEAELKKQGALQ
jgi:copper(I)-binding protein